jgi:hypothetical protein
MVLRPNLFVTPIWPRWYLVPFHIAVWASIKRRQLHTPFLLSVPPPLLAYAMNMYPHERGDTDDNSDIACM